MIKMADFVLVARSSAIKDAIDGAGRPGQIKIFTGSRPDGGGEPNAPALVTVALNLPCGIVDEQGLHLTTSGVAQVLYAGTATWARIVDGAGHRILDIDCNQHGDSTDAEMTFDNAKFLPGAYINLGSLLIAEVS